MAEEPHEAQKSARGDNAVQAAFSTLESLPMTPEDRVPPGKQTGGGGNIKTTPR